MRADKPQSLGAVRGVRSALRRKKVSRADDTGGDGEDDAEDGECSPAGRGGCERRCGKDEVRGQSNAPGAGEHAASIRSRLEDASIGLGDRGRCREPPPGTDTLRTMAPVGGALGTLVQCLNSLKARGLIGEHAIGGAMAFIYWAEPFETKDFDVFAVLPTSAAGLIDLGPVWKYLVDHGGVPEGQFVRFGRLLLDIIPPGDALDEEAIATAVAIRVDDQTTRVFTPEHAVAIALRTGRGKDREHIDRLLRTGRRPLDVARLQEIIRRFGLEDRWQRFKEIYDVHLE